MYFFADFPPQFITHTHKDISSDIHDIHNICILFISTMQAFVTLRKSKIHVSFLICFNLRMQKLNGHENGSRVAPMSSVRMHASDSSATLRLLPRFTNVIFYFAELSHAKLNHSIFLCPSSEAYLIYKSCRRLAVL
jgi:hypothetical protein